MSEFYFIEDLTEEDIHSGEVYVKSAKDRTQLTGGRKTSIEEELDALMMYNQNPEVAEYFPEPQQAIRNKDEDLIAYTMEVVNTDTRIEYSLDNNPRALVENAFSKLEDVITTIHKDSELPPHGDLIGNTFFEYGTPTIIDPRGIPDSKTEEAEWERDDEWQLDWLRDSALPDKENIMI